VSPVVTINSRNQSIPAILIKPAGVPKGAVILFAGDNGRLDIQSDGTIRFLQDNFLVRARSLFARAGYVALLPDLARDMKKGDDDVVANYRGSQDYAVDVNHMVRYMRSQDIRKVWTIGTSRGTLSVANYVARSSTPRELTPDGAIYTSGYWKLGTDVTGFTIWKLANGDAHKLRVPTLLVVHKQDQCPDTNPDDLSDFSDWLSGGGGPVSVMTFTGGKPSSPQSGPCGALSQHGFYGLDKEVVKRITGWIGQRG
jgi:dienelactone hydrolase